MKGSEEQRARSLSIRRFLSPSLTLHSSLWSFTRVAGREPTKEVTGHTRSEGMRVGRVTREGNRNERNDRTKGPRDGRMKRKRHEGRKIGTGGTFMARMLMVQVNRLYLSAFLSGPLRVPFAGRNDTRDGRREKGDRQSRKGSVKRRLSVRQRFYDRKGTLQ